MKMFLLSLGSALIIISLSICNTGAYVQMEDIPDSITVENGSISGVILDCPYKLEEGDEVGLVVKWYYNTYSIPIYQWIIGNKPNTFGGILKGRVDLTYEISDDEMHKYRALAIIEPTIELTGNYSCWASNFKNEGFTQISLTVYNPATDMTIEFVRLDPKTVLIQCNADGLFPRPKMELFKYEIDTNKYLPEEEVDTNVEQSQEIGTYNISISKNYTHENLNYENIFLCSLTLPSTDYQLEKNLSYYPAVEAGIPGLKFDIWTIVACLLPLLCHILER